MNLPARLNGISIVILLVGVSPAFAQAPQWTVEVHGGGMNHTGKGTLTLPPPGSSTSLEGGPSRQNPSWFFGDGAKLFNEWAASQPTQIRMTPLDNALRSAVGMGSGPGFGVRVTRDLNPRLAIEGAVDIMTSGSGWTDSARTDVEATRASFATGFLFVTKPFPNGKVATDADVPANSQRPMLISAAIDVKLGQGSLMPYIAIGGGVMSFIGSSLPITLKGDYQFSDFGFSTTFHETDTTTIHYNHRVTAGLIAGGGLRKSFSSKSAIQVDGRMFVGPNPVEVFLDAAPQNLTTSSFANVAAIYTGTPALIIGNPPFAQPSLSPPALTNFKAVSGGSTTIVMVTVGYCRRF